jgi:hypothetical protein
MFTFHKSKISYLCNQNGYNVWVLCLQTQSQIFENCELIYNSNRERVPINQSERKKES